MKLRNPFTEQTRHLFDLYKCGECGQNGGGQLQLHHILGRQSASPFNAIRLCYSCHEKVTHSREEHHRYFYQTFHWLLHTGYKIKKKDYDFLRENHDELFSTKLLKELKPNGN